MYKKCIKRFLDIVLSLLVCVAGIPLFLIIAAAIWLEDRGPVFYKGERLGKGCRTFKMYKFRSMKQNAPDIRNADGSTYNARTDPRVTRVGRLLRKTSMDELPQVINVLRGEMSLIGPRASTVDALKRFKPDELDKMKVRPGISGYCQAYGRNRLSVREKHLLDAWYANNLTPWLDVRIFFKTIAVVFKADDLYTTPTAAKVTTEATEVRVEIIPSEPEISRV